MFVIVLFDSWDWEVLFVGVDWLYLLGIIFVFGFGGCVVVLVVVVVVIVCGVLMLFDGNYCVWLWEVWDGCLCEMLYVLVV